MGDEVPGLVPFSDFEDDEEAEEEEQEEGAGGRRARHADEMPVAYRPATALRSPFRDPSAGERYSALRMIRRAGRRTPALLVM